MRSKQIMDMGEIMNQVNLNFSSSNGRTSNQQSSGGSKSLLLGQLSNSKSKNAFDDKFKALQEFAQPIQLSLKNLQNK